MIKNRTFWIIASAPSKAINYYLLGGEKGQTVCARQYDLYLSSQKTALNSLMRFFILLKRTTAENLGSIGFAVKLKGQEMNIDLVEDIEKMHDKFGIVNWVHARLSAGEYDKLQALLDFRINTLLTEEFNETVKACEEQDAEELVDGLIDIVVIALGTLDIFGVDSKTAWSRVMAANMAKAPGVKATRPNPLGLPDLIKAADWKAPEHTDNHGLLPLLVESYPDKSV